MKVGVNGAVRDISDLKVGVSGAVRQASELWIGVNGAVKKVWPTLPVGTEFIINTVGQNTWVCPVSGLYRIELHGGGGGGGGANYYSTSIYSYYSHFGGGGGGSGMVVEVSLQKGNSYSITIGKGGSAGQAGNEALGTNGKAGGSSSFASTYTVNGGGGGQGDETDYLKPSVGGSASGNIARSGEDGDFVNGAGIPVARDGGAGGSGGGKYGNTYGRGGNGGGSSSTFPITALDGYAGANGACIITYLG